MSARGVLNGVLEPFGYRIVKPKMRPPGDHVRYRRFWINRACALLGTAEKKLTPIQREVAGKLFEVHRRHWLSGKTPEPIEAGCYGPAESRVDPRGLKVAVVMSEHINNHPAFVENDICYHFRKSAAEIGLQVEYFPADKFTYSTLEHWFNPDTKRILPRPIRRVISAVPVSPAESLAELDKFIARTKPDFVAFEGNFMPGKRDIQVDDWDRLKRKHGFKLLTIICDCYDHAPPMLDYWGPVTDLCVISHRRTKHYDNFSDKEKVLIYASIPFHAPTFAGDGNTSHEFDLSYLGSDSRGRRLFMNAARDAGILTLCKFHNRTRAQAPSLAEFASILRRSKLTFNNGWLGINYEGVVTGRVAEAILSGSVLLQEIGTPINEYLVPFVHYVPIVNVHQLIVFSQFLLEDEERRSTISSEAYQFWREHYSSAHFWKCALERLFDSNRLSARRERLSRSPAPTLSNA